ncbi:MAG: TatD family hydrolase [Gemmatimonadaceae bacterium]
MRASVVPFADSHVHLADAAFTEDVDEVVARARAAGARALVCIGESAAAAARAQQVAARHPSLVFHTCGVHPYDANHWDASRDTDAIRHAVAAGAVAVGECGLDYQYENAVPEVQRAVLREQLTLAAELARPVIVHTRGAEADTIAMLQDAGAQGIRGVLHCFTGSLAMATAALEAGWYISYSGIVTFKKWTDDDLMRLVPLDRLLVESDAPYLAPVPHRGTRNESAWVALTLARVAQVHGLSPEWLGPRTLQNTQCLFSLPESVCADAPVATISPIN